jgi:type III pantothenate kinase
MLLAIDVGNTNIVVGIFDGQRLAHSWRLQTLRDRTADELGIQLLHLFEHQHLDIAAIDGIVVASVVPPLTGTFVDMGTRYFGRTALIVDASVDAGMPILYDTPGDVGADRIVNGIAAYEGHGRAAQAPLIVVDFGTATTFDAISGRGEYLGGVICPGLQISADALFQRAARLPRVEVKKPSTVIGRTTVGAMQSGLYYGHVAMIEGIVGRMRVELGGANAPEAVGCIATGGMAGVIGSETNIFDVIDPDLTLRGLRLVWDRTR